MLYAERLMRWPLDQAEAAIEEWTNTNPWWPAWNDLRTLLPEPPPPLEAPKRLPSPSGERWSYRCKRLFPNPAADAIRFARIGVHRWAPLMKRHQTLDDAQLIAEVERLDRGERAPEHGEEPFATRGQWQGFADAMRKLRQLPATAAMHARLIEIGETIEARQTPNAVARGWAVEV